jgi:hypothetical protein
MSNILGEYAPIPLGGHGLKPMAYQWSAKISAPPPTFYCLFSAPVVSPLVSCPALVSYPDPSLFCSGGCTCTCCITSTRKEGSGYSYTVWVWSGGICIEPKGARCHVIFELWTAGTHDRSDIACTDMAMHRLSVEWGLVKFIDVVDYYRTRLRRWATQHTGISLRKKLFS